MPNWCNTRMEITGHEEDVKRFINSVKVEDVEEDIYDYSTSYPYEKTGSRIVQRTEIIKSFIPIPEELYSVMVPIREEQAELAQRMKEKYGSTDWHSWQYENWGVKWGDCHTELDDEGDDTDAKGNHVAVYRFDTAWGTATKAFLKISAMFPDLRFDFFHVEEGGFFQGSEVIKNGKLVYERFFSPSDYPVPFPDEDSEDARDKWSEDHDEWCFQIQMEIDDEVDAVIA